ncbi:MAG: heme A synthase [Bdellovibrionales bacterium]
MSESHAQAPRLSSLPVRPWPGAGWDLPRWYVPAFTLLLVATFGLIALGGATRIMNAGLACPDWPLCFGDVIPDYHPQVYFEFIHRVVAGTVALATIVLMSILWWRSTAPRWLKRMGAGVVVLLAAQVVMGGLTVLLQLHSKVVAAHLGMGTGFFALLLWMHLSIKSEHKPENSVGPSWLWGASLLMVMLVYGQVLLGGLVASHFAALVCTDFPTCHGQWFPTFRGIIGLHVIHRLGAYVVFAFALVSAVSIYRYSASVRLKRLAGWLLACVLVQIGIGVANVVFHTPPVIAVAHLATATAILGFAIRQLHLTSRARLPLLKKS